MAEKASSRKQPAESRKRLWEVAPITIREEVNQAVDRAVATPEKTSLDTELKRMKLDQIRKLQEEHEMNQMKVIVEEERINVAELTGRRKELEAQKRGASQQAQQQQTDASQQGVVFTVADAVELGKLAPDQRADAIKVLLMMKPSGGDGGYGILPMLLANYGQQNPKAGIEEMLQFSRAITEAAKAMNAEKHQSGGNDQATIDKVIALAKDAYGGNKTPPAPGFWDQVMGDDAKFEKLQKLFGGGKHDAESNTNSSIEKLRIEKQYEVDMRKLDQESELKKQEIEVELKKADIFGDGIKKVVKAAGAAFAEGESEVDQAQAPEENRRQPTSADAAALGIMKIQCPTKGCGAPIIVQNPKPGEEIKCAKCGAVYEYQPDNNSPGQTGGEGA